ncbi:MAG: hypothetical protein AAF902_19840 [Chloroflexota bacterium]
MNRFKFLIIVCTGLFTAVLLLISIPAPTSAQSAPTLPPRPTPEAESTPDAALLGATIQLNIRAAEATSIDADDWAIVQWQDERGDWNNVEGWQGYLEYDAASQTWKVIWWTSRENFGEESFRWAIYTDKQLASLEATSETFDLPKSSLEAVIVTLKD